MSNLRQMTGEREYNCSMYLARLFFKHAATKFSAVLLCVYAVTVLPLGVLVFLAEAQFITALLLMAGSALMAVGIFIAIKDSKECGTMFGLSFILMVIGASLLICEKAYGLIRFLNIENVLHVIFLLLFIVLMLSFRGAAKGNEPKLFTGYLYAFAGIGAAAFSVFTLLTCVGFFQACYRNTYDWDFLVETVGTDSIKNLEHYDYMFLGANFASKYTKAIMLARTAERGMCIIAILLSSVIMLKLTPHLNEEKKRVDFASEAGGFEFFDDDDSFRAIGKKQRAQSSDGFGQDHHENDGFDDIQDDFSDDEPELQNDKPGANEFGDYFDENDGIYYYFDAESKKYYYVDEGSGECRYKEEKKKSDGKKSVNEFGDYFDENDGIYYYFDADSGRYYYVDEASGECKYKEEKRRSAPLSRQKQQPSVTGETMPWEEEADEEDNIYNY